MNIEQNKTGYMDPKISVCRQSKTIAIFDGFTLVRDFQAYGMESEAITEAHEWLKARTIHVPQVIFPMVRKMQLS